MSPASQYDWRQNFASFGLRAAVRGWACPVVSFSTSGVDSPNESNRKRAWLFFGLAGQRPNGIAPGLASAVRSVNWRH